MKKLFPAQLDLKYKPCLVVGGGKVALRKILSLKECGARVHVVSPQVEERISHLAAEGKLKWIERVYAPTYLEGVHLVICATDDEQLNAKVAEDCAERGILVNVADNGQQSSFIMPAVMRQGDLTIAISTNGASPALAAKLRKQFEAEFGPEYQEFLVLMAEMRKEVIKKVPDRDKRQSVFASLVDSDLLELLRQGDKTKVKERIAQCISLQ